MTYPPRSASFVIVTTTLLTASGATAGVNYLHGTLAQVVTVSTGISLEALVMLGGPLVVVMLSVWRLMWQVSQLRKENWTRSDHRDFAQQLKIDNPALRVRVNGVDHDE